LATPQYFCPGLQVKTYKYPKVERDYSDQVLADQLKNRAVGWKNDGNCALVIIPLAAPAYLPGTRISVVCAQMPFFFKLCARDCAEDLSVVRAKQLEPLPLIPAPIKPLCGWPSTSISWAISG